VRVLFPSSYVPDLDKCVLRWFSVLARGACARWRILINDSHASCSWFHGVTGRVLLLSNFFPADSLLIFLPSLLRLVFCQISLSGLARTHFLCLILPDSACCFGFSLPPLNRWPAPGLLLIHDFQLVCLMAPA
jgi:hypothetical protein